MPPFRRPQRWEPNHDRAHTRFIGTERSAFAARERQHHQPPAGRSGHPQRGPPTAAQPVLEEHFGHRPGGAHGDGHVHLVRVPLLRRQRRCGEGQVLAAGSPISCGSRHPATGHDPAGQAPRTRIGAYPCRGGRPHQLEAFRHGCPIRTQDLVTGRRARAGGVVPPGWHPWQQRRLNADVQRPCSLHVQAVAGLPAPAARASGQPDPRQRLAGRSGRCSQCVPTTARQRPQPSIGRGGAVRCRAPPHHA